MVHHSNARTATLTRFIMDNVPGCTSAALEVSPVKRDGTVFIKFRSSAEASAAQLTSSFAEALREAGRAYAQVDVNKVRLPLEQFAP